VQKKKGNGVQGNPWLTRRSPAVAVWPEERRRRQNRRLQRQFPAEKRRRRRRLRASRGDSAGGEEEGGEAELGAISEEARAAWNGEGRRRPSSGSQACTGGRGERAKEGKKEGEVAWRAGKVSRGFFSSSRRQAGRGSPAALRRTRKCSAYWKKKKILQKPPRV
jgi:hypothetical protein